MEDVEKLLVWVRITIQVLIEKMQKYANLSELFSKEFLIDESFFGNL